MSAKKLTFIEHLEELRNRIIKSIIFIIAAAGLLYALTDEILIFIVRPVGRLVFIAPQEAFITSIELALFGGLFLSSPFVFYEIWQFISAALEKDEKRCALSFGLFSFVLFLLGIFFGYFIIVPIGMKFLLGFGSDFVTPMISVGRYVSFVGTLTFVFGIVFQLPLAILFLSKIGIVTPQFLSRNRKYAVVIIFILSAIFTPPDVITQCLMAVPLVILYELSIQLSKFWVGSRKDFNYESVGDKR